MKAINYLEQCRGKIIVVGLGKSGIAGKKIAATFASTGAPALFLHAAEAIHGDMGVISAGDVAITLSYSGETEEILSLIPRFKLLGVPVIAITGNPASSMAKASDCILNVSVPSHPWPFGLVPTASYTATVAIGDALAITLLVRRGIREEDFALLHPGGLLGRKMLANISDLMHTGDELPLVRLHDKMKTVLMEMTAKRLGVACIVNDAGQLLGIITDGDLRRLLEQTDNPLELTAKNAMTADPKSISPDTLSARALHYMESHSITSLPVVDDDHKLVGIIHIHDIIKLETNR